MLIRELQASPALGDDPVIQLTKDSLKNWFHYPLVSFENLFDREG